MSATRGPVVLITGATGPVGRATVRRFAAEGARLALNGSNRGRLEQLLADLDLPPGAAIPVEADLRDPEAARTAVAAAEAAFGGIDVLAHLVGGFVSGTPVAELDHDEVRRMLDQHLWTTLNVLQAVLPGMASRGFGRVVVVSSPLAANPGARGASYAAAKAVEEVLVRSVAREQASDGITANILVVRTVDADHARLREPSKANATWTTPEEVAEAIAWLASPAAAAVNGARIPLDGR